MKIAELVEALEAVRAITGECEVIIHTPNGEIDNIVDVEVTGKPGALSCAIKIIPLVK